MSVWQALGNRRFLMTAWPCRAAGYLLTEALTGAVTLVAVVLLLVLNLPALTLLGLPVGRAGRRSLRIVDARSVPAGHRTPSRPGPRAWLTTRWRSRPPGVHSGTPCCWPSCGPSTCSPSG